MRYLDDQWKLDFASFLKSKKYSMRAITEIVDFLEEWTPTIPETVEYVESCAPQMKDIIDYLEAHPAVYLKETQVEEVA